MLCRFKNGYFDDWKQNIKIIVLHRIVQIVDYFAVNFLNLTQFITTRKKLKLPIETLFSIQTSVKCNNNITLNWIVIFRIIFFPPSKMNKFLKTDFLNDWESIICRSSQLNEGLIKRGNDLLDISLDS